MKSQSGFPRTRNKKPAVPAARMRTNFADLLATGAVLAVFGIVVVLSSIFMGYL